MASTSAAWKTCSAGRRRRLKPLFGTFIIGDELLVGKRQDKHLPFLIEALAKRGLRLSWAHYLGDEPDRITAALRLSFATQEVVFSFGGIGATPDDHTRQCAARALNVGLKLHPEAEREIRARFGGEASPQRLMMGEFPEGAGIIPNPINRVPGFSIGHHHFVPGFPQMAWPMVEWVLDTHYRNLFDRDRWREASILVYEAGESQLIGAMEAVGAQFSGVKVFSLPSMGPKGERVHVELGVRGDPAQVDGAIDSLRAMVGKLGFPYKENATK